MHCTKIIFGTLVWYYDALLDVSPQYEKKAVILIKWSACVAGVHSVNSISSLTINVELSQVNEL